MTATLGAIVLLLVLGLPIARCVDRRGDALMLGGTAFLYGSGAMYLVLFALSMLGISWTAVSVGLTGFMVFGVATYFAMRRGPPAGPMRIPGLHVIDVLTLAVVAGYAVYATLAPPWEVDFWAIWGLKARAFLEAGGIDWRFLESRWNAFQHPDYPLLVPLDYDFAGVLGGQWNDRGTGLFSVAWGVSLILVVRSLASRAMAPTCASLTALALAASCLAPRVGLAEGALVAFGGASLLFLREALREGDASAWLHGALLLGFAADCKNEGLALMASVALALAIAGPRPEIASRLKRLWPACLLALPWIAVRALHALPTDLANAGILERFLDRLGHAGQVFGLLASHLFMPWAWASLVAAFLVVPAAAIARERFVIAALSIQLAFFVAAYFATPYNVEWHIWTSWSRLTGQLMVPLSFVAMSMLAAAISVGTARGPTKST